MILMTALVLQNKSLVLILVKKIQSFAWFDVGWLQCYW